MEAFDPFVSRETYKRDIHRPIRKPGDPPDEVVGWVEFRPLNAGDRAEFNEIRLSQDGGSVDVGLIQLLMTKRAIVSWSFEKDPTVDVIRQLDPAIFDEIYEYVSLGNPTLADEVEELKEAERGDPLDGTPDAERVVAPGGNS